MPETSVYPYNLHTNPLLHLFDIYHCARLPADTYTKAEADISLCRNLKSARQLMDIVSTSLAIQTNGPIIFSR